MVRSARFPRLVALRRFLARNEPGIVGGGGFGNPAGWPLTFAFNSTIGGTSYGYFSNSGNTINLIGMVLVAAVRFSQMGIVIQAPPQGETLNVGLYSLAGLLLCQTGPTADSVGHTWLAPLLGGTVLLQPGRYYIATSSTGNLQTTDAAVSGYGVSSFCIATDFLANAGAVLPPTLSPPPDNPGPGRVPMLALLL